MKELLPTSNCQSCDYKTRKHYNILHLSLCPAGPARPLPTSCVCWSIFRQTFKIQTMQLKYKKKWMCRPRREKVQPDSISLALTAFRLSAPCRLLLTYSLFLCPFPRHIVHIFSRVYSVLCLCLKSGVFIDFYRRLNQCDAPYRASYTVIKAISTRRAQKLYRVNQTRLEKSFRLPCTAECSCEAGKEF